MFILSMHVTISFLKYLIYHYLMFRRVCFGEHAGLHIFCVLAHKPPALKSYIHFYSQAKPWPLYFPCILLNSLPHCLALLFSKWSFPVLLCSNPINFFLLNSKVSSFRKHSLFLSSRSHDPSPNCK